MKIVQLSDMHLTAEADATAAYGRMTDVVRTIRPHIKERERVIFCCCGDVIDRADVGGFAIAKGMWEQVRKDLTGHEPVFLFVPGNHDCVERDFTHLDAFILEVTGETVDWSHNDALLKTCDGISLILLNSTHHKDAKYGSINMDALRNKLEAAVGPPLLIAHHTLLSRYADDASSIRNSFALISALSKSRAIGFLHGHTHGYSAMTIGTDCPLVGVGPLLKEVPGVASQFNLISIEGERIERVDNYRFQSDLPDLFRPFTVLEREEKSVFAGTAFSEVHRQILAAAKAKGIVANLRMTISSDWDSVGDDLKANYSESLRTAREWLSSTVPNSLHYNHGTHISGAKANMLEHVKKELSRKSTSCRAVISLLENDRVVESDDGFLPSLNVVQLGFNDEKRDELLVTLYLRALEVGRFLPINVCEAYLIAEDVRTTFRAIGRVVLTINAFRAQVIDKFGCLRKAELDTLSQSELTILLSEKDYARLSKLLSEKRTMSETVVVDTGMHALRTCLSEVLKMRPSWTVSNLEFLISLKDKMDRLIELRAELKRARSRTSLHSDAETSRLQSQLAALMLTTEQLVEAHNG